MKRVGRGCAKRRAQRRAEQFGPQAKLVRGYACCACGAQPPSNPHHVRSRGAGGTDADAVPLCELCHRDVHAHGASWLELSRGISLADTAREFALRVSGGGAWSDEMMLAQITKRQAMDIVLERVCPPKGLCAEAFRGRWATRA